jgi:putative nucleotidyltransferase with HDIG domain
MWPRIIRQLKEANKELWLFLMMFAILAAFNYLVASDRMMLGFYVLPTVFSAYFYGRRHATLTALASVLLVILIVYLNPRLFTQGGPVRGIAEKWYDIAIWGGTLIVIAYAMGTLYEKKEAHIRELKDAYKGILQILARFIGHDEYTYHHSVRVAAYADVIGEYMRLDPNRRGDLKDAALLHDLGKREVPRELLYRAARFSESEYDEMKKHVEKGAQVIEPLGGSLARIIPIILAHHDRFDGSGYHPTQGEDIPLEARIIAVADVYDAMTSDRPYAKAMSSLDAKEVITKGSGTDFDPIVVNAFLKAYQSGALEVDFADLEMRRH